MATKTGNVFNRLLLPGFAFKAVIIGGGYSTGRELVEFLFPSGPVGGLLGNLVAMVIWSAICAVTFLFARMTQSYDYVAFFKNLLGPLWIVFEIAYIMLIMLVLSVASAAAGEITHALLGVPSLVGTIGLAAGIALVVSFGNESVERLFKYLSFFLYAVYAIFIVLAMFSFGDRIVQNLTAGIPTDGWFEGGVTYASYNMIAAVVILPMLRHMTSNRDAVIAGIFCGPLAVLPGILFFLCASAYYPELKSEALPSNYLLERMQLPIFHVIFDVMILSALLKSSTGLTHAINERAAAVYAIRGAKMPERVRFGLAVGLLVLSIVVAARFGLIGLIKKGYGASAYVFFAIYILPLLTVGIWRMWRMRRAIREKVAVVEACSAV